jgi:hypothetical protein
LVFNVLNEHPWIPKPFFLKIWQCWIITTPSNLYELCIKFKGELKGTHIICLGPLDREIFDRGILAVFEGLLGVCYKNSVLNINKYCGANNFLLNEP